MSFEQRVALVTGSSRGIGSAIAVAFGHAGADVAVNYRSATGSSSEKAERVCEQIRSLGRRALAVRADIGRAEECRELIGVTVQTLGRLDFLVLNAARAPFKPYEDLLERELHDLVQTNFIGNLLCLRAALPWLEKSSGKVVFVSSLGSRHYSPAYPLGSMKAAMEVVVRDCAESLKPRHVAVNAVCGGLVRTDSFKLLRQVWERLEALPEEALVAPEEIAEVVLFLCSPAARAICGQTVVVDRGLANHLFR